MAATFIVEDGSVIANANALVSLADANQIDENFSSSAAWVAATDEVKQNAIREATRYLNFFFIWLGYKVDADQTCQWPRFEMEDEDGNAISEVIVPQAVKEACTYLAIKVIDGDTLLEDFDNESKIKKMKDVLGPITEEREFIQGEKPGKTYQLVDKLLAPFIRKKGYYSPAEVVRG
jgi:hypothetical protein